jgi:hypothetical protein
MGKWKLDLDANADLILVVDGVNERKARIHHRGPQARLVGEITRHLGSTIPSICFQTGMTKRVTFEVSGRQGSLVLGGEAYLGGYCSRPLLLPSSLFSCSPPPPVGGGGRQKGRQT